MPRRSSGADAGGPRLHLPWPLPALLTWVAAWSVFLGLCWLGASPVFAFLLAAGGAAMLASRGATPWRRVFIGAGFPLSVAASGSVVGVPAWTWLLPLALLAWLYPMKAWRDAPLFPTPANALRGLARLAPLKDGARIVDAGCGLGSGLRELRGEYPHARLTGLEWSWPLWLACAWRTPFATVRRADIWRADWSDYDMVYLFQRPESMSRAAVKAQQELRPHAWLASLEFDVPGLRAQQTLDCPDGRRVWLYQAPFRRG